MSFNLRVRASNILSTSGMQLVRLFGAAVLMITETACQQQLRLKFAGGAAGDAQEAHVLGCCAAFMPLGNVVRDRT